MGNLNMLLFFTALSITFGSTVKSSSEPGSEDTTTSVKQTKEMEDTLLGKLQNLTKEHELLDARLSQVETELKRELKALETTGNPIRGMINFYTASQSQVEKGFRENTSSSVETLRQYFNTLMRLEKSLPNFTDKTSIGGSLLPKALLDEVVQMKESGQLDILEMRKNLINLTSEVGALNKRLLDIQRPCAGDPPSLKNGKTTNFERWHGSSVRYECYRNFIMTGDSTVHCEFGKWEGHPPACSYFDVTFYAEASYSRPRYMECYSDTNANKILFSQGIDVQTSRKLWTGIQDTSETSVRLYLDDVLPSRAYTYNSGPYWCEFTTQEDTAEIAVPYQGGTLYFPDPFQVANTGDTVIFRLHSRFPYPILWYRDGSRIPSWDDKVEAVIEEVTADDAGIYHARYEGDPLSEAYVRLFVRKCKANLYGERCDKVCPPCHNGGICHDIFGMCVCPEGFVGSNCETPCPSGFHGTNCTKPCENGDCDHLLYCKPHPYGCACARGFKGALCEENCDAGWYGAGCKQQCHCARGPKTCNRFTGACSQGCSPGWKGESCQIKAGDNSSA